MMITPKIFASEINSRAIWLLNRNRVANGCKNIEILKGDFISHVNQLRNQQIAFKAIYTNPPLKLGYARLIEIFDAAMRLLTDDGFIQYVHPKNLGAITFLDKLIALKPEWKAKTIRKKGGFYVNVISPKEFDYTVDESKSNYF